ncbi:Glycosyltransferase family 64 protein C4 [Gracilariopsis chorda]|uniref:Glycosyltransferase family 64 protein C4 n=1 Tax=Gracilariopsis chorda TaxID=448386 RepID=A0A2V3ISV2_9FLOR|nr:Glycosyltransferase family 64 protein C4 [Gracilariopsis chorda]|eukprot:PXF45198.1 Glycosyltransferase family 64 protein C4 [Gracilariopsis chorda]
MESYRSRLIILFFLLLTPLTVAIDTSISETIEQVDRHAFASLLCDPETLPAVEALAHSIRFADHDEPFLIIVPSSVPDFVVGRINDLPNTHAFEADSLPYPFNSTADRMSIHKPCRFLKLQLWGLTRWRKIIFLDADTIIRNNVAELFEAPGFSAVKDPVGMNYNTGVIVIEPSRYVYSLIVNNYVHAGSYNVGDQGALNALIDFDAWNPLPMRYNTFHTAPEEAFNDAKIVHYSGDAKPWNFWNARGHGRIPTRAFVEWCHMAENTPTAACHMRGKVDHREKVGLMKKRYRDSVDDQFLSVLLSTYNRDSWSELSLFYAKLDFVKEVYVVWQNMNRTREPAPHEKVRFVYPDSDSLNNRYLAADLSEDCVYICDDDIYVPAHTLMSGFEVWKQNPARLVGFYPRMWYPIPGSYTVNIAGGYNIVLTKGMFAHRSFLTAYSLFLPKRLTNIVDEHMNCEDILFNMMAVGMTGLPPLAVMSNETIHDVGKDKGISGPKGSGHLRVRDYCVQSFMRLGMDQPTLASRGSILPLARKNHVVGAIGD